MKLIIEGFVARQGRSKGGRESVEIRVSEEFWERVPFPKDVKTPLTLRIGAITGSGRFLYQSENRPYISEAFTDQSGTKNLAEALDATGLRPKDRVRLEIDGTVVTVSALQSPVVVVPPPPTPAASDIAPPPRVKTTTYRILRDTEVAREVKRKHGCLCQICGESIELPNGERYAEAHHIQPLGAEEPGPDIQENVLCVCPNHHAELDLGLWDVVIENLKTADGHTVGPEYVRYHNEVVRKRWR